MAPETPRAPRIRLASALLARGSLVGIFCLAAGPVFAEPAACFPGCGLPEPAFIVADYEDDYGRTDYRARAEAAREEREAAREERRRLEAQRRERLESESRARAKLRKLEQKLEAGRREERINKYGSSSPSAYYSSYGSNDGQAGAHCIYGTDDRLIYAPDGARCASEKGGAIPGPAAPSPSFHQGCAKGNCQHGEGTYVWADGSRYTGGFRKGLQHGHGSIAFRNGASYVGGWKDGKRSGSGTAIFPDGRVKAGRWKDNRFLGQATASALMRMDWPDLSSSPEPVGGGERDVAVIVGIQQYAHVSNIPGAAKNATDWYRYMVKTRGLPSDRVTLLLDQDATREEIRLAAEEAARLAGGKGQLWFVFIGHGAPSPSDQDGLLVGFDAQQKARSLSTRSVSRSEILRILESSRAARINVVLDACFSGKNNAGEQLVAGLQPLVVTHSEPTSDPRTTLMTAAASDEFAGPLPGAQRPAFSYLLLGGLRGWADEDSDGRVSAGELHRYTSRTLRSTLRGRSQTPSLVGREAVRLVRSADEAGPDVADLLLRATETASAR